METNALVDTNQTSPGAISALNLFDPQTFATAQRMAQLLANSELVPDMYKISDKNPKDKAVANCIIAIDIATRTGTSMLMVMQNLFPIKGTPSWSSKFLIATINSCGRFKPLAYELKNKGKLGKVKYTDYNTERTFDGSEIDNIECVAYTSAKNSNNILKSAPVSVEMAIKEGWYLKKGSKWPSMTQQMLMYRAASFWCKVYAPEISMGMQTAEEIIDITHANPNHTMPDTSEANTKELPIDVECKEVPDTEPPPITAEEAAEINQREIEEAEAAEPPFME